MPRFTIAAAALALTALLAQPAIGSSDPVKLPPPAADITSSATTETAVFAGGCFWGVQAVFQHTRGVLNALSGYAGGDKGSASYQLVSAGRTKHAESVEITYDPRQVSYGKLLQIYFSVAHDPTTLNRQGPDVGPHYRSAVFYRTPEQKRVTEAYIAQLDAAKAFRSKIVTQVTPLEAFYPAEAYHQDYATLNPNQPYIVYHDKPKIANLKALMPEVFREKPVLVGARTPTPQ
jgi:peptide-methionine (S)-S-oxide reductase